MNGEERAKELCASRINSEFDKASPRSYNTLSKEYYSALESTGYELLMEMLE